MSTKESVRPDSGWQVFKVFLRLGLTSFGGPLAHLGYFHAEFVRRRQWLSERSYADLVALCQFLPGPASSQVGIAIGLARAGHGGALAAWAGFTLPSALLLILFALGLSAWGDLLPPGLVHGLKVVAVAVVAQAVWGMARVFCTSARGLALMLGAAAVLLFWASPLAQVSVILLAGLLGLWLFTAEPADAHQPLSVPPGRGVALALLGLFFLLLLGLPLLAQLWPVPWLERVDAFYRAGSLVFGGGHVVLPLLQSEVVGTGWVSNETFLAGYGATQAVPGPLFTFAAFLGAAMQEAPSGWAGGLLCLGAVFAPSFLLVIGTLPFWVRLRANRHSGAALQGVNAAVVGVLLAALYDPVWTSAILGPEDFVLALAALGALMAWKLPPWLVVLGCALAGWGLEVLL